MEISAEKIKLMINSAKGMQREIKDKRQKLGRVTSFRNLGAIVSDEGSKPEVLSRIVLRARRNEKELNVKPATTF